MLFAATEDERRALSRRGFQEVEQPVYVYNRKVEGSSEIFRIVNPVDGDIVYTTSPEEKDYYVEQGWVQQASLGFTQATSSSGTGILLGTTVKLEADDLRLVSQTEEWGKEIVFSGTNSKIAALAPGAVLYSEESAVLPLGLVAKISTVSRNGLGETQIETVPADLLEAFAEYHIYLDNRRLYFLPSDSDSESPASALPMVGQPQPEELRPSAASGELLPEYLFGRRPVAMVQLAASATLTAGLNYNKDLYTRTVKGTTYVINVTGNLTFSATSEVLMSGSGVLPTSGTLLVTPNVAGGLTVTLSASSSVSKDDIPVLGPFTGTFLLGGIPVGATLNLYGGYGASASVAAALGGSANAQVTGGISYDIVPPSLSLIFCPNPCPAGFNCGVTPVVGPTCGFTAGINGSFTVDAQANVYVKPQLYLYVGAHGTGIGPTVYAKLQLQSKLEPPYLNVYFQLVPGVGGAILVASIRVVQYAPQVGAGISAKVLSLPLIVAPTVTSFEINNGATSTTNRTVTLNNTTTGNPTQYMASESASFSGASWQTYSTAPSFTLSPAAGAKTVYFGVRNSAGTSYYMTASITLIAAPSVTTRAPSAVTYSSATLAGSVNPKGADTHAWFQYSTSSSMTGSQSTPQQDIGSGTSAVSISGDISGLSASTTYYFQAVASNSVGTNYGSVLSFTTLAQPPTVSTGSASNITAISATLTGTVNPNGLDTNYQFDYGTSSDPSLLGNHAPAPRQDIGSGTTASPVSANISGLNCNTPYYFQLKAWNVAGVSAGTIASFTTTGSIAISTVSPSSITLVQGGSAQSVTVDLTRTCYTDSVTLTTSALPSGVSASFNQPGKKNSGSITLVAASNAALVSNQTITITASGNEVSSVTATFNLTTCGPPTVSTGSASAATYSTATLGGSVNPNGADTHVWFQYSTSSSMSGSQSTPQQDIGLGAASFSANLSGLSGSTTYYFQAVASNSGGTNYGSVGSFTTPAQPPTVSTGSASAVTYSTATLGGSVNPNGADTHVWFQYSTSSSMSGSQSTPQQDMRSGTSTVSFTANLSGLTASTTYYFQAVASNSGGTNYASVASLTTSAPVPPTVTTGSASAPTYSTATLGGSANPNGADTHVWFQYSTSSSMSGSQSTPQQDIGLGAASFSANLSGLSGSTTYYFQAVASNSGGTNYGSVGSFTTPAQPPTVSTGSASAVTYSTATLGGSVNPNGADTHVWFQYSTSSSMSGSQSTPQQDMRSGTSTVSFSANLSGLSASTTYYFQAVASNSGGTNYASVASLTTSAPVPPTVTTGSASAPTYSTATLGGSANPNGADTHVWFQYSTNSSMSASQSTPQQDIGLGAASFSANLSGLSGSTTYYFQAVASNSGGTNSGSVGSFTTPAQPPTISTGSASAPTYSTATLGGSVNPNGAADTHIWFQYSTSSSMSGSQSTPQQDMGSGTSTVSFSGNLSGLSGSTTYYFQAVASNSGGTNYGSVGSFTTPAQPPTVSTGSASAVTYSTATLGGSVNPNGADTHVWFQYSTSSSMSGSQSTPQQDMRSGTSTVSFSANLSGLSGSTTYYFQAVASNGGGTNSGSVGSFTTPARPPTVSTGSASAVSSSAATLGGSVNPNGTDTHVWFQYSTNSSMSGSQSTQQQDMGSGTSTVSFSAGLSGLSGSTTYYFQAVASNSGGTNSGSVGSFTTPAEPPTVSTGSASNITDNSATLSGTVNPNGLDTKYQFVYGTSSDESALGLHTARLDMGSGTSASSVNANISGLAANTTYYFQLKAWNNAGESDGTINSFTTSKK
jgi:phosphodiesterase/alkaline phosphatase D-like protein